MEVSLVSYHISPLGDSALLIDFGNKIDDTINKNVLARTHQLNKNLNGVKEIVPAYSSISVFFDLVKWKKQTPAGQRVFDNLRETIESLLLQPISNEEIKEQIRIIPVCYDFELAPDLAELSKNKNIPAEEIIAIHLSKIYRVYMLGFLPGFTYMGQVDDRIAMPRKLKPQPVLAGSVGIAGKQTGIYPTPAPGGWHIIGRTPLTLFDENAIQPALLNAGDLVQFYSINKQEFYEIQISGKTEK